MVKHCSVKLRVYLEWNHKQKKNEACPWLHFADDDGMMAPSYLILGFALQQKPHNHPHAHTFSSDQLFELLDLCRVHWEIIILSCFCVKKKSGPKIETFKIDDLIKKTLFSEMSVKIKITWNNYNNNYINMFQQNRNFPCLHQLRSHADEWIKWKGFYRIDARMGFSSVFFPSVPAKQTSQIPCGRRCGLRRVQDFFFCSRYRAVLIVCLTSKVGVTGNWIAHWG